MKPRVVGTDLQVCPRTAWAVDELDENLAQIYTAQGTDGLPAIPGIGSKIARESEAMLQEQT